ncbi:flagellin [Salaquimonas pukyongi]|uniref:flagellin N-terminal helical domain-containing protein n=1 Tax=Salaquimonas pukyongi TaxID=2712698 RepID=UPI00096BB38D|nr:flagellin [Salaquimonas pukyongi]
MSSINTNPSAMTALQSLKVTNKALEDTQNAISTGFRVASARDNAAYWSIATTMRSDNKALSTVQDALGLGAATVDVMYTAVSSSIDAVDEIKAKLVAAREPGVDRAKIQSEISELQAQLRGNAEAASFSGENWLAVDSSLPNYTATKEVVSSFSRSDTGVAVSTITIDLTTVKLYDDNDQSGVLDTETTTTGGGAVTVSVSTLDITAANIDNTDIDELISFVDSALLQMTTTATHLGSAQARIELQQSFVSNLMDAVDRGIGQLVDADLNEESTRLQALQVQQQLGIQSLSIANANSQNILSLFRG